VGDAAAQQSDPEVDARTFSNVPGTRALMRAGIYWIHEAVGFAMTQQPRFAENR